MVTFRYYISPEVGDKVYILLFNSCVKFYWKNLHELPKYQQQFKGLFFSRLVYQRFWRAKLVKFTWTFRPPLRNFSFLLYYSRVSNRFLFSVVLSVFDAHLFFNYLKLSVYRCKTVGSHRIIADTNTQIHTRVGLCRVFLYPNYSLDYNVTILCFFKPFCRQFIFILYPQPYFFFYS